MTAGRPNFDAVQVLLENPNIGVVLSQQLCEVEKSPMWDYLWAGLQIAFTSTVVTGAVAFVIQSLFHRWLDKDIEAYKAKLSHQLDLAKLEHEVMFRRLDDKVSEAMVEAYRHLHRVHDAVEDYSRIVTYNDEPSYEDKLNKAREITKAGFDYLFLNRPYIPKPLFDRTNQMMRQFVDVANKITKVLQHEAEDTHQWSRQLDVINNELSPLIADYVAAVQARLGVKDESDSIKA